MNNISTMNLAADNIRILIAAMVEKAKSGHPGGAMGGADFINVLFSEFLVYDPDNPFWESRDRFFLDPGHMSPMLYSVLALSGKYTIEDLKNFRQWGSNTPGHPELCVERGIENTSGPLGQGHTYAVGAAIAAKFLKARLGDVMNHTIYAYISDGGIQEEISQGAGRIAGHLGLDNLIMFYDANDIQLSTAVSDVTSEDVATKYKTWGWEVFEIDGNDVAQIREALTKAKNVTDKPTLIIGHTIMGKGTRRADGSSYENDCGTHGAPLGGDAYINTIKNLGGDLENPFVFYPEVEQLYKDRQQELRKIVAEQKKQKEIWAKENPTLANKMESWFSGNASQINWDAITQKRDIPTRNASAAVLTQCSYDVENMIISSADLCNSDKSDGFLKNSSIFKKGDFSGGFLQAGVSELTMACCTIGMVLHGGVIAGCATFFVFSDYMKPALRMAALMRTPVKFFWSHDSFRVGEDGPTHQPIEQETQVRLLEKMKNHMGKSSMLVMRPVDADETTACWKLAIENTSSPSALIFSRQNIKSLPEETPYSEASKGAYIVSEDKDFDVILVASGSEVSTLLDTATLLREDNIRVRVVSCPSEGLFRSQDKEYQNSILPTDAKIFGLTAGLSVNLEGLVGPLGMVYGIQGFGYSAPFKVLEEKLGFTAENIYKEVKNFLA